MTARPYDVLIVGSGIMGAGVARAIRDADPHARIVMVEAAPVIGSVPGQHLHDSAEPEIWARYNASVSSGVQALYVGAESTPDIGDTVVGAAPGIYSLGSFGENAAELPGSAVAWNAGGMGVHWTAATPWPSGSEVFAGGGQGVGSAAAAGVAGDEQAATGSAAARQWQADLDRARELLHVNPNPYGTSAAGAVVLRRLDEAFAAVSADGRHVQPMPMAINRVSAGHLWRTGPNRIFEPLGTGDDDDFTLLTETVCLRVMHDDGRAVGAEVRDLATGDARVIEARAVVLCADALRTPQLLWASAIRPPALGHHLNEHAFLSGRVIVDHEGLGIDLAEIPMPRDGEWFCGSYWLPANGPGQPFHGQIMDSPIIDDAGTTVGYSVGLSWYVPTETRADNRLEFSDTELDPAGLPRMTVHFSYSPADLALIQDARASQARAATRLGAFDPALDAALLAPGSSLHYTGTVRMGETDDGTSVCDTGARIWGYDNLFVAGNGVVPTALACNSTLTAMITAVRAARSVLAVLAAA
ncbi:GMC oxidoreductase [Subtercola sp. YIM 133946]|uniref:GMC oxidoreductase n=1 Tax=Subtercola sp. YIM 133946 TaxID=3118909 RepID=UPI002F94AA56